ncbi:hypothetical protein ACR6C2_25315 [Streptomyces sp. INA 01156]
MLGVLGYTLGYAYLSRAQMSGSRADMHQAVMHMETALESLGGLVTFETLSHVNAAPVQGLSALLGSDPEHLREGLRRTRSALGKPGLTFDFEIKTRISLAVGLDILRLRTGDPDALDESIAELESACRLLPPEGAPDAQSVYWLLASRLADRATDRPGTRRPRRTSRPPCPPRVGRCGPSRTRSCSSSACATVCASPGEARTTAAPRPPGRWPRGGWTRRSTAWRRGAPWCSRRRPSPGASPTGSRPWEPWSSRTGGARRSRPRHPARGRRRFPRRRARSGPGSRSRPCSRRAGTAPAPGDVRRQALDLLRSGQRETDDMTPAERVAALRDGLVRADVDALVHLLPGGGTDDGAVLLVTPEGPARSVPLSALSAEGRVPLSAFLDAEAERKRVDADTGSSRRRRGAPRHGGGGARRGVRLGRGGADARTGHAGRVAAGPRRIGVGARSAGRRSGRPGGAAGPGAVRHPRCGALARGGAASPAELGGPEEVRAFEVSVISHAASGQEFLRASARTRMPR